jgi:hypothetical protein
LPNEDATPPVTKMCLGVPERSAMELQSIS